ncbi:GIY-YIG nuclease family protein [Paraburkholderia sp. PREW-6R]|uniref:GIY-YIG nuclease family protein n=1 Tax=Paraburkholderia sp. PREW-6R TaxID=3141544 RepID=UPI0031F556A7
MAWFLYLLECSDGSVYTGIATDVQARFEKHASGVGARYTRSRKPVRVLVSFELPDRASASRAEYWVKRLTPPQKRALAAGGRTLESVMPALPLEAEAETKAETEAETKAEQEARPEAPTDTASPAESASASC